MLERYELRLEYSVGSTDGGRRQTHGLTHVLFFRKTLIAFVLLMIVPMRDALARGSQDYSLSLTYKAGSVLLSLAQT